MGLLKTSGDAPLQGNSILQEMMKRRPAVASKPVVEKASYSHSLEEIYAIETVDIRTVRPMAVRQEVKPEAVTPRFEVAIEDGPQLSLDLGDFFRGWIESFVLLEPIRVLGLSNHSEECLAKHGKRILQDIIGIHFDDFLFFKGMGQGHIDEVQQKLRQYLASKVLYRCRRVDFAALLSALAVNVETKKMHVVMAAYGLSNLFPLTPAQRGEIFRLDENGKAKWRDEVFSLLSCEELQKQLRRVGEVFLRPWVIKRGGFVSQSDIEERLDAISVEPNYTTSLFRFFQDLLNKPFGEILPFRLVDENVYADALHEAEYQRVTSLAESYFYSSDVKYPLNRLIDYIIRQRVMAWETVDRGQIEKAIRLCPRFYAFKGPKGNLIVKLDRPSDQKFLPV